jgi:hypothetical protein
VGVTDVYWRDKKKGMFHNETTEAHFRLQNAKQVADMMKEGFTPRPVTVNFECGRCG